MPSPPPRRSLVTGGAGFIGSNLVDRLVDRGDTVIVLDDLSTGRRANLDGAIRAGARLVEADVRDADAVDAAFRQATPHRVFHLAAQIDVRRSVEDPAFDADVNVRGTINVLAAAHRHGVARVVNTSTGGAIYGAADTIPSPEDTPERPESAYGTSKLCAEHYCDWYARLHGLSTATVRLANVYGPRQDPLGEAGVIAIFCDRLLRGEQPTVYGDGTQTRDFVFVGDVVDAQLAVAEASVNGTVNVGTAQETSIAELVGTVATAGGVPRSAFLPIHEAARDGEVHRSCLAIAHAAASVGFAPTVPLLQGLSRTLAWHRTPGGTASSAPIQPTPPHEIHRGH